MIASWFKRNNTGECDMIGHTPNPDAQACFASSMHGLETFFYLKKHFEALVGQRTFSAKGFILFF